MTSAELAFFDEAAHRAMSQLLRFYSGEDAEGASTNNPDQTLAKRSCDIAQAMLIERTKRLRPSGASAKASKPHRHDFSKSDICSKCYVLKV